MPESADSVAVGDGLRPSRRARAAAILWSATAAVLALALAASVLTVVVVARRIRPEIVPATLLVAAAAPIAAALIIGVGTIARRRPRAALVAAMALLLATRLGLAVLIDAAVVSDWGRYHRLALGALQGAPPIADVPMGYPILLGAAYRVGGVSAMSGEMLNVALSIAAAGCLAAWLWLIASPRAAALGVAVFALTPSNVFFVTVLASENGFSLVVTVVVLAATVMLRALGHGRQRASLILAVIVGCALGLGACVRTTSLALLPLVAVLPLVVVGSPRRSVPLAGVVVLATVVTLAPVIAWNRVTLDRWSASTSLYLGWQLYVGLNVEKYGGYNVDDQDRVNRRVGDDGTWRAVSREYAAGRFDPLPVRQAAERDAVAMALAVERLRRDATRIPLLLPFKFARAWAPGDYPVRTALDIEPRHVDRRLAAAAHLGSQLWWIGLLAAGTAWFVRERRRRPEHGFAVSAVVLPMAIGLLVLEAQARYHEPVVPLLAGLAGIMLADATGRAAHPRPELRRLAGSRATRRDGRGTDVVP